MDLPLIKPAALFLFMAGVFLTVYQILPRQKPGRMDTEDDEASEHSRIILVFKPIYQLFVPILRRLPVPGYRTRLNRYIVTAGLESDIDADDLMGFQIVLMMLFTLSGHVFFDAVAFRVLAPVLGLCYPYLWLHEKKKERQQEIILSMPDIVDMLSLSVEAGMSFNTAVEKICEIYRDDRDPFVAELYLMDKNIKLGRSRDESLKIMAERIDLMELDSFASILIQANKMGSSISQVLRSQAERMRAERFMKAEKFGAQASQKLLIPMMVFIFPIIFIIIFGPYIIQFIAR